MSSNKNPHGVIIQIGDILVSEDVVCAYFACDYTRCKGCCCIIGDSGAPLEETELDRLEENYPVYAPLMRPQGRAQVEKDGFFTVDRDGDLVTPVVRAPRNAPSRHSMPTAHVSAPSSAAFSRGLAPSGSRSRAGSIRCG